MSEESQHEKYQYKLKRLDFEKEQAETNRRDKLDEAARQRNHELKLAEQMQKFVLSLMQQQQEQIHVILREKRS